MRSLMRNASFIAIAFAVPLGLAVPGQLQAQGGVPDPDGFTYYWPGACTQAISRSGAFYWRARQDTAQYSHTTDTMLAPAVQIAKQCVTKFAGADLVARDYVPLARVHLAAGDDAAAKEVIARRLTLPDVQTPGPRAWELSHVVQAYLGASPGRLDAAKEYLAQLDALAGPDAAVGKVRAYFSLASYYRRVGDVSNMTGAAERLIAVGKDLNEHDREEFGLTLFAGYRYLAEAAGARTGDSVAPKAVLTRAAADVGRLMGVQNSLRGSMSVFGAYGAKAQRIVADAWVNSSADAVYPAAGKFTLIAFRPYRGNIPALRRISERHKANLNFVSIIGTIGYFRDLGPLTPDVEAKYVEEYYRKDLNVSTPVVLNTTVFNRIPDGRRVAEATPNETAYRARSGAGYILVDPQGIIRQIWTGPWDRAYENRIEEAIKRLSTKTP